jgi:peroxiredoxin Q/BCP
MAMAKNNLKIGSKVTNLSLPSTEGSEFSLKDLLGKKVVLYFYPKDSTPGCTVQGQEFSKLSAQFKKHNTEVFGISRDSMNSHNKFKEKQNFKIDLLSDEQETACKMFDVIHEKNMYGKKVMGVVRSTFVIDEKGVLLNEWRKVKAEGHAAEVLNYIKSLK